MCAEFMKENVFTVGFIGQTGQTCFLLTVVFKSVVMFFILLSDFINMQPVEIV